MATTTAELPLTPGRKAQRAAIEAELHAIAKRDGGVLQPLAVVSYARSTDTALHSCFTWDDTKAAEQYRLWQARQVIRVVVGVIVPKVEQTRVFVSLLDDRQQEGGGYRLTKVVLCDMDARKRLLAEAMAELQVFKRKYAIFKELSPIFAAMRKVQKRRKS